eukprot:4737727-Pyramimonas_sp.AAC.1
MLTPSQTPDCEKRQAKVGPQAGSEGEGRAQHHQLHSTRCEQLKANVEPDRRRTSPTSSATVLGSGRSAGTMRATHQLQRWEWSCEKAGGGRHISYNAGSRSCEKAGREQHISYNAGS